MENRPETNVARKSNQMHKSNPIQLRGRQAQNATDGAMGWVVAGPIHDGRPTPRRSASASAPRRRPVPSLLSLPFLPPIPLFTALPSTTPLFTCPPPVKWAGVRAAGLGGLGCGRGGRLGRHELVWRGPWRAGRGWDWVMWRGVGVGWGVRLVRGTRVGGGEGGGWAGAGVGGVVEPDRGLLPLLLLRVRVSAQRLQSAVITAQHLRSRREGGRESAGAAGRLGWRWRACCTACRGARPTARPASRPAAASRAASSRCPPPPSLAFPSAHHRSRTVPPLSR
jgi:hypothetical protein